MKKLRKRLLQQRFCPFCKTEIDIEATRCPHCTSVLEDEKPEEKLINDCIESSNK